MSRRPWLNVPPQRGACGKMIYPSKADAKRAARHTESTGHGAKVGRMEAYECGRCAGWHIGHPKGKHRRREAS